MLSTRYYAEKVAQQEQNIFYTNTGQPFEAKLKLALSTVSNIPPTISNGKLIFVKYNVEILLKINKGRSDLKITIPVTLGTTNTTQQTPAYAPQTQIQASAVMNQQQYIQAQGQQPHQQQYMMAPGQQPQPQQYMMAPGQQQQQPQYMVAPGQQPQPQYMMAPGQQQQPQYIMAPGQQPGVVYMAQPGVMMMPSNGQS